MYKFIPQFSGRLAAPLISGATTMQLAPADAAFLAAQLAGGRWTYVALAEESHREVVRINSVSGSNAAIVRGRDSTTARAWATGDCFTSVLGPSAVLDLVTQGAVDTALSIAGAGAVTVTQPTPRNFVVSVPPTSVVACPDPAIEVLGSFPSFTVCFDRAMIGAPCGSPSFTDPGEGGAVPGTGELIVGSGAALVSFDSGVGEYQVFVPPVTLSAGDNIVVTGSFPNFTIAYSGPIGGSGTVTTVTAGTGITVTGSPTTAPIVGISNTGVIAGNYAGFQVDGTGRILSMPVSAGVNSGPVMSVTPFSDVTTLNALGIGQTGHTVTIRAFAATSALDGWGVVRLAAPTAGASRDSAESTRAVTPAGLDAVLASFTPLPVGGLGGASSGEGSAAYSITAASGAVTLEAGQALLLTATAVAVHSVTPTTTQASFGIALFVDGVLQTATRTVPTNTHTVMARITGAGLKTFELKHTILAANFSITTAQIQHIVVKE